MSRIVTYIIGFLFSILVVFGILLSIKCSKLERENIKLKTEQNSLVDSIKMENKLLKENINLLNYDLQQSKHKIDSLNEVKQTIIVKKEYIVSENLTEGVKTLKENLKWEKR